MNFFHVYFLFHVPTNIFCQNLVPPYKNLPNYSVVTIWWMFHSSRLITGCLQHVTIYLFFLFLLSEFSYTHNSMAVFCDCCVHLHSSFHFTCDINFFRVASIIHGDIRIILTNFFPFIHSFSKYTHITCPWESEKNEMTTNASLSLLITFFSFILLIFGRENEHVKGKVSSFLNKLERKAIFELFMDENRTHFVFVQIRLVISIYCH